MSMDSAIFTGTVKDMNQPLFTKVPTWCPSVNSPPNFRKPQYKEILVKMNTKTKVELLVSNYLQCKPRSIMLIPEQIDIANSPAALIL